MKITLKKIGDVAVPAHDSDREKWQKFIDAEYEVTITNIDLLTDQQRKALHKLYSLTAEQLNDAGYTVNIVLNKRKFEAIEKVFAWGIDKLAVIPGAELVLNKMKDRILQKEEHEVMWTTQTVKDLIWRPLQLHLVQKKSTTKLNRVEIDKIYDTYNMIMSDRYGIHVQFPSKKLWDEKEK